MHKGLVRYISVPRPADRSSTRILSSKIIVGRRTRSKVAQLRTPNAIPRCSQLGSREPRLRGVEPVGHAAIHKDAVLNAATNHSRGSFVPYPFAGAEDLAGHQNQRNASYPVSQYVPTSHRLIAPLLSVFQHSRSSIHKRARRARPRCDRGARLP